MNDKTKQKILVLEGEEVSAARDIMDILGSLRIQVEQLSMGTAVFLILEGEEEAFAELLTLRPDLKLRDDVPVSYPEM